MRVLYFGSPAIAVAPLEQLVTAGCQIVGVVTQPDRPAGRKRVMTPPPVKQAAEQCGLSVLQPETLRKPEIVAELTALRPDVGVVVAYGKILPQSVLDIPPLGLLNIHPSLLPLHRGPAPVSGAILAGDRETGVSIMQLDQGMDSGPLLAQVTVTLPPDARTGALTNELMQLGGKMLLEVLPRHAASQLSPHPQDHSRASYTRLIAKDDGRIDWKLPALVLERQIRAYDPWPTAFTTWQGNLLKVLDGMVLPDWAGSEAPGTLVTISDWRGWPTVATGSGALVLRQVQPAGRRTMPGTDWLRGQTQSPGQQMGK